jgi:hypothetical protein
MLKLYRVYLIESPWHWYVGSTTQTIARRLNGHLAVSGKSPIRALKQAGIEFGVSVLEECVGTRDVRLAAEQRWYDHMSAIEMRICLNRKDPIKG